MSKCKCKCTFSSSTDQHYPRLCTKCRYLEPDDQADDQRVIRNKENKDE